MPTKDELEAQLASANDRIAELEAARPDAPEPGTANPPRTPQRPDFGLSAGEMDDLKNNGVTTSPFNGEEINAIDEKVETSTPEAKRNAQRAQARKRQRQQLPNRPAPEADSIGTADVAATNA